MPRVPAGVKAQRPGQGGSQNLARGVRQLPLVVHVVVFVTPGRRLGAKHAAQGTWATYHKVRYCYFTTWAQLRPPSPTCSRNCSNGLVIRFGHGFSSTWHGYTLAMIMRAPMQQSAPPAPKCALANSCIPCRLTRRSVANNTNPSLTHHINMPPCTPALGSAGLCSREHQRRHGVPLRQGSVFPRAPRLQPRPHGLSDGGDVDGGTGPKVGRVGAKVVPVMRRSAHAGRGAYLNEYVLWAPLEGSTGAVVHVWIFSLQSNFTPSFLLQHSIPSQKAL